MGAGPWVSGAQHLSCLAGWALNLSGHQLGDGSWVGHQDGDGKSTTTAHLLVRLGNDGLADGRRLLEKARDKVHPK
ncbi:hypothetical protein V6N11_046716 [Hibiscus sabdariffa]|uniref:Uncharacterized protein n=1 Tax=Hibiscus sabdariffa TaxID=183260 RepID=A0ABR2NGF5_9ROSI